MFPEMLEDTVKIIEEEFDKEPLTSLGIFAKGFILSLLDKKIPSLIKYYTYTAYGLDGMLSEEEHNLYVDAQKAYKELMEKLDKLTPLA